MTKKKKQTEKTERTERTEGVGRPLIFLPANAKLNFEGVKAEPPKTKYEKTRRVLRRENVNKVVKGKYGQGK